MHRVTMSGISLKCANDDQLVSSCYFISSLKALISLESFSNIRQDCLNL